MGLSSNTLLHQTNHAGLSGIIRDKGFKVLYSLEEIKSPSPYPFKFAFPMISFSDIPFTELSSHFTTVRLKIIHKSIAQPCNMLDVSKRLFRKPTSPLSKERHLYCTWTPSTTFGSFFV